jgi:hypothetical protein
MPLVTWDDLQRPAPSDPSRSVWQLVQQRIHDPDRPMPPPEFPPLDLDQADTLDDWMAGGANQGSEQCGAAPEPPPPPIPHAPCDHPEVYTAHAVAAPDLGFPVPGPDYHDGDVTVCFTANRPLGAPAQAIAWAPVVSDARVIHHISLFATAEPIPEGFIGPCAFKNATYLMGWEPGRGTTALPDDVGLELPTRGSRGMILEVHYHNTRGYKIADASGMAICTTDTPRRYAAGVVTLGTESIVVPPRGRAEATGICPQAVTRELSEPLHVLSTAPHMHNTGLSLTTEVVHTDGTYEVLAPPQRWDPHQQPLFEHQPPIEVRPGDLLRTICRYDNRGDSPVVFGSRASDEMCYSYNLVYPISALPRRLDEAPLRLCDCATGDLCTP